MRYVYKWPQETHVETHVETHERTLQHSFTLVQIGSEKPVKILLALANKVPFGSSVETYI